MSGIEREKWNKRYQGSAYAEPSQPSALLQDWIEIVPPGRALDVACGAGRNALYLAQRGFSVDAVDISDEALNRGRESARLAGLSISWQARDLDEPLPLENSYQLIVIMRYVNLPLIRRLCASLAPGGFLICEQHLATEADVIGPKNPVYRLSPGAMLDAVATLQVHHIEEGLVKEPSGRTAALARLIAQRA